MPERNVQKAVITQLEARGAWVLNVHGSSFTRRGAPDVIACYRGRFIAVECKDPDARTQPGRRSHQDHELRLIRLAGGLAIYSSDPGDLRALLDGLDEILDRDPNSTDTPRLPPVPRNVVSIQTRRHGRL